LLTVTSWAPEPAKLPRNAAAWFCVKVDPVTETVTLAVPESRIVIPLPPVVAEFGPMVVPVIVRSSVPLAGVSR
jgi:hypothetical protein